MNSSVLRKEIESSKGHFLVYIALIRINVIWINNWNVNALNKMNSN